MLPAGMLENISASLDDKDIAALACINRGYGQGFFQLLLRPGQLFNFIINGDESAAKIILTRHPMHFNIQDLVNAHSKLKLDPACK